MKLFKILRAYPYQTIKPPAFATLIYLKIFTGLSILLKVALIVLFQNTEYRY